MGVINGMQSYFAIDIINIKYELSLDFIVSLMRWNLDYTNIIGADRGVLKF